jgi:F1F0 ATPase subunit 2
MPEISGAFRMRFLICLILATVAGVLYFRFLSWTIDRAMRKGSSKGQVLLVAGFLLRYIVFGLILVFLMKWEPYGAIAALLGFFIGRAIVTSRKLIRM